MDKKGYLATELSPLIGVPRTTINDWLVKYAAYIDCDSRGKRRVYPEEAVAVLKEIAALRAEGKNAFEIGAALEAKHGVRPELEKPEAADLSAPGSGSENRPAAENSALARQSKADALALFEEQMHQWQCQLAESRQERLKSTRRGFILLAVLLVLLFGAGSAAAVFFALRAADRLQQEKQGWELRFSAMEKQRRKRDQEQQQSVTRLTELLKLSEQKRQEQLQLQKKQFESELSRLEKENRDLAAQEQLKLRSEFAASQKRLLDELAASRSEVREISRQNREILQRTAPKEEKQP